jgi:hypothetical protein
MPNERGTVFEVSQIGPETTPGTTVPATRRLQSLKIVPKIETKTTPFAPNGYKYDSIMSVDQEWTSAKVDGTADYNQMIYALSGLFGAVTPTVVPTGTLTNQWVFNPSTNNPETPKTFTIESGSSARAGKFGYGLFTEWGVTYTRADIKVAGALLGQRYTDGITMTAGPSEVQTLTVTGAPTGGNIPLTYLGSSTGTTVAFNATSSAIVTALTALPSIGVGGVTATGGPLPTTPVVITFAGGLANASHPLIVASSANLTGGTTPTATVAETTPGGFDLVAQPIFPTQHTIYVDSSAANLGVTALTRPFSFDWKITNKWGPVWPINAANTSFPVHVEMNPKLTANLLVEADAAGMGFLTNFRAGSTMFVRVGCVGPIIESALTYLYNADFACKVTGLSEFKDEKGVYAISYALDIMHDNVWGQSMAHTIQSKQTTL